MYKVRHPSPYRDSLNSPAYETPPIEKRLISMARRRRRRRKKSSSVIENSEDITINGGNFVQAASSARVTVVTNNSSANAVNVVLVQMNVNVSMDGHMHGGMVLVCHFFTMLALWMTNNADR
jgi:hypothetical protein